MINLTDEQFDTLVDIGYELNAEFDNEDIELVNRTEFKTVDEAIKELRDSLDKGFSEEEIKMFGDGTEFYKNYLYCIEKYEGKDYIIVPYHDLSCYSITVYAVMTKDFEYISNFTL